MKGYCRAAWVVLCHRKRIESRHWARLKKRKPGEEKVALNHTQQPNVINNTPTTTPNYNQQQIKNNTKYITKS